MWNLSTVGNKLIKLLIPQNKMAIEGVSIILKNKQYNTAMETLTLLHDIQSKENFERLLEPQICINEGDIDFSYYHLEARHSVSLYIEENGKVILHVHNDNKSVEYSNPLRREIINALQELKDTIKD